MKPVKIPEYLNVIDTSRIMEVSPQVVREFCSQGRLEAKEIVPNSGRWKIKTSELINYPGWLIATQLKKIKIMYWMNY